MALESEFESLEQPHLGAIVTAAGESLGLLSLPLGDSGDEGVEAPTHPTLF